MPSRLLGALRFAGAALGGKIPAHDFLAAKRLLDHRRAFRQGDHSAFGEAEKVLSLLARLDMDAGVAVDVAASDGVFQSCTLGLFRDAGWGGLAVECGPAKFTKLAWAYEGLERVGLARLAVTPSAVVPLLEGFRIPKDFDFLNLDIDSYDLPVMRALLRGGYRPKLISMEINEKIPPPLHFEVLWRPDHFYGGDHFYGCSASAAATTLRRSGYGLESIVGNNAFFVWGPLARSHGVADRPVAEAYREGYREFPDRKRRFWYNRDVDAALAMAPAAAEAFFRNLFRAHDGRYVLRALAPGNAMARGRRFKTGAHPRTRP